jgi:hypothetical protein
MRRGFLLLGSLAAALLAGPIYGGAVAGCSRAELETNPRLDAAPDVEDEPEIDAGPPPIETSRKVDLLLVVDNSQNTDVAQQTLAETIPYLIDRLIHPPCVNGLGNVVAVPKTQAEPCPVGRRDFAPIDDFHLAMISTSLGGHGADTCSPKDPTFQPSKNDAAHLLSRAAGGGPIPTYQSKGFLAWDLLQTNTPPGDKDQAAITKSFAEMVKGAGQGGCGFEAPLESFYRFLIDPNPPKEIVVLGGQATPKDTDSTVLQQRADFLRPDSALVILLLTDENDCSIREEGESFLVAQTANPEGGPNGFRMPRGRSECAKDPNDPCCASCTQVTPEGCSPTKTDAACQNPVLSAAEDPISLRCFDQKRRFGVDVLYPVERYVKGLSEPTIKGRDDRVVDNPLFAGNRSPKLVIFGGIVGVPWQDVAKDPTSLTTGFAPPSEINWELLLGDPEKGTPPTDSLMIESIDARTGTNPPTKTELAPPTATSAAANPINGHERVIPGRDDLQYACIYPRQATKTCSGDGCECDGAKINTNPLCQQPDGSYSAVQRFAQALPSPRQLQLIRALGDRAAVGSICASSVTGPDQALFGYKPSIDAVLRALRGRIQ